MKTLFHKTAYLVVLMAMILLMGERLVPHHHCGEGSHVTETIHFGFGECHECEHAHTEDDHAHSEEQCCDDSQPLFRIADGDSNPVKKVLEPCDDSFILPEPQLLASHTFSSFSCHCRFKIPDRSAPYTALRAPPVA